MLLAWLPVSIALTGWDHKGSSVGVCHSMHYEVQTLFSSLAYLHFLTWGVRLGALSAFDHCRSADIHWKVRIHGNGTYGYSQEVPMLDALVCWPQCGVEFGDCNFKMLPSSPAMAPGVGQVMRSGPVDAGTSCHFLIGHAIPSCFCKMAKLLVAESLHVCLIVSHSWHGAFTLSDSSVHM